MAARKKKGKKRPASPLSFFKEQKKNAFRGLGGGQDARFSRSLRSACCPHQPFRLPSLDGELRRPLRFLWSPGSSTTSQRSACRTVACTATSCARKRHFGLPGILAPDLRIPPALNRAPRKNSSSR